MHIAIVTGGYYGLSGVFTHARDLSRQLSKHGVYVTVLSPDVQESDSNERLQFVRIRDIRFVPQLVFYLTSLIFNHRRYKIDVIYCLDSIAFIIAVIFGKLWRVPTVFCFQASIFSPGREVDSSRLGVCIYKFTNRLAARAANAIVCVSEEMVRCARLAGADDNEITLISNLVDLEPFEKIRHVRKVNHSKQLVCLYVGALRPTKGVEFLIRAIPVVAQKVPEIRFILVGDGPERRKLEELARELDAESYLDFIGKLTWEQVLQYYERADIFILPSISDPMPLVIPEAMAAGLPVIGSRVDGIPEIIRDGYNGLLVEPKNSGTLANAIMRLLEDDRLLEECSRNALRTAEEFSWQKNIEKFEFIFMMV